MAASKFFCLVVMLLTIVSIHGFENSLSCPANASLVVKDNTCICAEKETAGENKTSIHAAFEENVVIAFALVSGAGLSTSFGAAMVFCHYCVRQERFLILGASLAFSGGVMIYVSLIEIFQKSILAFEECNSVTENPCLWKDDGSGSAAYTMATICVFSGILFTLFLDLVVTCLSRMGGSHGHSHALPSENHSSGNCEGLDTGTSTSKETHDERNVEAIQDIQLESEGETNVSSKVDPIVQMKADSHHEEKKRLKHMGLMTALAIGLHNFPEGLATFVATLADPAVGASLAIAIAIHNIPEGLCVAIPLYYSTGSRCKGFWFAFMSGITEIIGATLGYLILRSVLGPAAYGVLFGLVCGMMVTITVKELLPTAHRYDPQDRLVTKSFFLGAFVMALSLVLFVS